MWGHDEQAKTGPRNKSRLGTGIESRFGTEEMKQIAVLMARVVSNIGNTEVRDQVAGEVRSMSSRFPVPGIDD